MQSVSFKHVDEFLDYLPDDELQIVHLLREIIFDCLPNVQEKLCYNVPFYKIHKNICFIWPASVLWGKTKKYQGVRLGFNNGYLLHDEVNYLEKGERKQVYIKDFLSNNDIQPEILRMFLFEASEIDRTMYEMKKSSK